MRIKRLAGCGRGKRPQTGLFDLSREGGELDRQCAEPESHIRSGVGAEAGQTSIGLGHPFVVIFLIVVHTVTSN